MAPRAARFAGMPCPVVDAYAQVRASVDPTTCCLSPGCKRGLVKQRDAMVSESR